MIQKYVSILVALLILYSNSGWALTFHYCKDRISSISLEYLHTPKLEKEDPCQVEKSCCGEENNHKKCCDEQSFESSSSDSKFISKTFELNLYTFILSEINSYSFENKSITKTKKRIPAFYVDVNAPPLYKLYCQLVFYA